MTTGLVEWGRHDIQQKENKQTKILWQDSKKYMKNFQMFYLKFWFHCGKKYFILNNSTQSQS